MKLRSSNWEAPACKFHIERDMDGRTLTVRGQFTNGVATAVFRLSRQKAGEYILRGRESIRSARTGHILTSVKTGKPMCADIRSNSEDELTLKKKVEDVFERLYTANVTTIYQDLGTCRTDDLTPSFALALFGKEFLTREMHAKGDSMARRLKKMRKIAVCLDRYRLDQIPLSALTDIKKASGRSSDDAFRMLYLFVTYLQRTHRYFGVNPFETYYAKYPKKTPRSLEEVLIAADKPRSLDDTVFQRLVRRIEAAPASDFKATGLLLIQHAGLNAAAACKLTWAEVMFGQISPFDDSCQISIWKEKTAGATHDYTRPVLRFCSGQLRRRYDELSQAGPVLDTRKVLNGLTPAALTAYCRTQLRLAGIESSKIEAARSKTMGGGVSLLLSDYRYRLTHHCGIGIGSEARYLQGLSMSTDVTADNYRSFTSPSGQKRLLIALRRDTRTVTGEPAAKVEIRKEETGTRIRVPPNDPARTTAASISLRLKKGQRITLLSEEGLMGTLVTEPLKK